MSRHDLTDVESRVIKPRLSAGFKPANDFFTSISTERYDYRRIDPRGKTFELLADYDE